LTVLFFSTSEFYLPSEELVEETEIRLDQDCAVSGGIKISTADIPFSLLARVMR
jgi:hypothetical protein